MATITSPRGESPASNTPRLKSPSIAETPTSSTRGSFEIPSNASSRGSVPNAVAAGVQPPRRGNRAALRDYYNLKSKPQPGAGVGRPQISRSASVTSATSDVSSVAPSVVTLTDNTSTTSALTAQLDSSDFDAEAYISDLLRTSSLREILKVEATLVSEVRNLDGERKALVYDNYSKLIKAVSTIGEMQRSMNETPGGGLSGVSDLEERLESLRTMVQEITKGKDEAEIQRAAKRRRERKAFKEQQQKRDIVKWVLEAPQRLARLLEDDEEEEAEKQWKIVVQYLDSWNGVTGVAEVRRACEDVMQGSENEAVANDDD